MTFTRDKLRGREWHKYTFLRQRLGASAPTKIKFAEEWARDNIQEGQWLAHIMDSAGCALFYIHDDEDAVLFELSQGFHATDRRGKKDWY
jgi:hypothetical protein